MGKTPTPSRKTKIILICCAAGFVAAAAAVLLGVLLTLPKQTEAVQYLPQSQKGEFLVAELSNTKRNGQPLIIARSYDGFPWEPVPDLDNKPAPVKCDDQNRCTLDIEEEFTTRTIDVPQELKELSPMHLAARLHMQATFGADKDELLRVAGVYGVDYGLWVLDQMRLTPTLTRSYFRERANARPGQFDIGLLTKPCDLGSRWHRYAFESRDKGKDIVVSKGTKAFILSIDGAPRTEVTAILNQNFPSNYTFPFTLRLCSVNEEIGGAMTLNNISNTNCNINMKNPTIEFASNSVVQTLGENDALLVPVVGARAGSFVLKSRTVSCANVTDVAGNNFIRQGNSTYRFDKRVRFMANTIEEPAVVEAAFSGQCPVIAKSYQNRDQCSRRASCGSAVSFKSATFTLNQNILRQWYTKSRRFVYYITDLRLEAPFDISPCTSRASRWLRLNSGTCASPTALDATTRATIAAALAASTDANPYVRDITLSGAGCTAATNTIGATVEAGGACYRHVHPDYYSVRDFTRWVDIHDGNKEAMAGGNPNPIANFAQIGEVNFKYPASHPMTRFFDRRGYIPLVARYGDSVDFQNLNVELQTEEIAAVVGALRVNSDKDGFEACGSPGETSTSPELGYHYSVGNWNNTGAIAEALEWPLPAYSDHRFILENVHLKAYDQLRQRVAWTLSNIVVIASQDIEMHDYTDAWTSFYDIFVRHAFGNYLEVMRDVSYHPLMGTYLSFRGNRAFAVANTYPDENYAREIMQLFSIGLWRLNDDGTQQLDSDGQPLETYTNADIMDFARIWTGFDRQLFRNNLATVYSVFGSNQNIIDNMQIRAQFRDRLPKAKLDDGYIGDTYPLCDDLPAQAFLREGARYEYTGPSSVEGDTLDLNATLVGRPRFTPPTTSALYQALCAPSAEKGGACTFPLRVTLTSNLPCTGDQECNAQRVIAVKIVDPVAKITRYYSYYGVPCVRLTLFDNGQIIKRASTRPQCADPTTRVAAPVCCKPATPTVAASNYTSECLFANEATDYATSKQRCENLGLGVCSGGLTSTASYANTCVRDVFMWTNASCSVQVQVYHSGQVGLVDPLSAGFLKILKANSSNVFRVRWEDNSFPATNDAGVCPDGCTALPTPEGDTCLCNVTVSSSALYNQLSDLNSISADDAVNTIAREASIGAPKPGLFDDGTYTKCSNDECNRLSNVAVWFHKDDNGLGQRTIFELPPFRQGGRVRYLLNRISVVHVANSFSFRNPPHFTPLLGELTDVGLEWNSDMLWTRRAEYEVEALLEHLFEHDNTAPFVAYRLIQHMVTSNPSPRYMRQVVQAFRTGSYGTVTFSGRYGDLAATVYAVLMDQEARSPIIEADPSYGMLRDPLLKIYHLMRALDYNSPKSREVALWDMDNRIGVEPFSSPTVFNFYLPEYRPAGVIGSNGLVGPQVQLATTPNLVGFINGITSLIDNGLTSCDSGFGVSNNWGGRTCVTTGPHPTADGTLSYTPPADATTSDIIDELNLLLTAGRLNQHTRDMLIREYDSIATNSTLAPAALRHALKLLVSSSEFQTSSFNLLTEQVRTEPTGVKGVGRRFKAIVVIFEYGGCDSFNLVVPHSNCPAKDMYAEYASVRTDAALKKEEVIQITSPAGTQVCNTFGVHPAMPKLAQLYKDGDALFATNVGAMVAPVTKDQLNKGTARVPPSLYAHNIMQRNVQNVYAQYISADGVLGRICDSLQEVATPYAAAVFSLGGNVKMTQGSIPADYISPSTGVVRVRGLNKIGNALGNITEFTSNSVFAETYADTLFASVRKTETLGTLLAATQLSTNFTKSGLDQQMVQVAKLIKALPDATGVERAVFFTQTGGFDTHNTFNLSPMLGTVDTSLGNFADEMKAQGRWDDVVVITVSDFARTLSSNGQGTDHAWGGNHFVAGGSVKGGQILGTYPDTLTDDGANILSRGRVIPTMPFEALWKGIAEWFDVPASEIDNVLPNVKNFPAEKIYGKDRMFN
jgi:uncharacterized protein (DUF1501 family)/uncharacterized protein (DUF1800 family)